MRDFGQLALCRSVARPKTVPVAIEKSKAFGECYKAVLAHVQQRSNILTANQGGLRYRWIWIRAATRARQWCVFEAQVPTDVDE